MSLGTVVEAMMRCSGSSLAYLVVSEGGVAGIGERLHALRPDEVKVTADGVSCDLDAKMLATRPVLDPRDWPASL